VLARGHLLGRGERASRCTVTRDVEPDERIGGQAVVDDCNIAKAVAVRADRDERRPVASER
jgi:hypothetical protein